MIGTDIRRALGELCGIEIDSRTYVGFFVNKHGEYLVFTQKREESTATLYHSDADWVPHPLTDYSIKVGGMVGDVPWDGMITVGDLIIDREEASWLAACLSATRHLRAR
ncbi:hypothetical protein ACSNOI_36400 [Actinomadura kijaniata]|uniref:hypothetical protein n=1 Tax=Actinomadura kijaniata TaxID=46161 RepID=UPI003F1D01F8